MSGTNFKLPDVVLHSNGMEEGKPTGGTHQCRLEGCRGLRIAVRWPAGNHTYPCSKGMMAVAPGRWQIMGGSMPPEMPT